MEKDGIARICRKLQNFNFYVVPRLTRGGGLAFLWKNDINVTVCNSSNHYIDAIIDHGTNDAWWFTGFYGDLDTANRENSWSLLRSLSHSMSLPWVCVGDFNEILFADEKQGWLDRPKRQMQGFRDALDYCGLKDLGFTDYPFTWCNRRPGDQNV